MKEHNQLVKFKNSFIADPNKRENLAPIISQDWVGTVGEKLRGLAEVYRTRSAQNGYSEDLAYRVIVLGLTCPKESGLDLRQEIDRFFRHCLGSEELAKLQMCFDLLLLKQLQSIVTKEHMRVLKVRILSALRRYYCRKGQKKEERKCGHTLLTFCKESLQKEEVKRNTEIYSEILDVMIIEVKRKVSVSVKKGNRIDASDLLSNFTQLLEKSEQVASSKYQSELLEAYWSLAALHEQMHYIAYAKKYAAIALNIALRSNQPASVQQIQQLLDRLS